MPITMSHEVLREMLRTETGRWLGKAIGLVRNPQRCYEAQVRGLWKDQLRPRRKQEELAGAVEVSYGTSGDSYGGRLRPGICHSCIAAA